MFYNYLSASRRYCLRIKKKEEKEMAWWNQTVSISRTADINVFQRVSIHPSTCARPQWGTILVNRPSRQTVVCLDCVQKHRKKKKKKRKKTSRLELNSGDNTASAGTFVWIHFTSCIRILRLPSAKTIIPFAFAVSSRSRLFSRQWRFLFF